jgi:hypothetical protein
MPQKLWSLPLQVPFLFGEVCHGRLRYVDVDAGGGISKLC